MENLIRNAPNSISKHFIRETHKKYDSILNQGDDIEYLYIIVSGRVEVQTVSKQGKEISLNTFEKGESFGVLEIFNSKLKTQTVLSLVDSEIIKLNKKYVYRWMREDFEFSLYLITLINEYFYDASTFARNLISLTVKERVILSIYHHYIDGSLAYLSKDKLMLETGTQIRSLNRALESLYSENILLYNKKNFIVKDIDKLKNLAIPLI